MICRMQPVADVATIAIHRQRLAGEQLRSSNPINLSAN
jgi:hypothetical protein